MDGSGTGRVGVIFVAAATGSTALAVEQVAAVAGRGLVGDRYFDTSHVPSPGGRGRSQVTLIASEVIATVARATGATPEPAGLRRNIVTAGIDLDELMGGTFLVGAVLMRALEVCEPCARVAAAAGDRGLLRSLVGRGGVRAEILTDGLITVGDPVAPAKQLARMA